MAHPPLDRPPSTAATPLLAASFTLTDLSGVRRDIEEVSRRCGLTDDQLEDWITAVNELLINAIRHGGGQGAVSITLDDQLVCEVTDRGFGFDTSEYVPPAARPPLSDVGGMGLWVVGQLAVFLTVDSGPSGTTVRIAARTRDDAD